MSDTDTAPEADQAADAEPVDSLTEDQQAFLDQVDEITEEMCEAYSLRDDLGERALIIPDPMHREPVEPYQSADSAEDDGFHDRDYIAHMLATMVERHNIFVNGADFPQLIRAKDQNHNVGYGYEGEAGLLAIVRERRHVWHVITGEAHTAGGRMQVSRHDTWTEAMTAARKEALRFPPPFMRRARVISGPEGSFSDKNFDWSKLPADAMEGRAPPGWE